MSWTIAKLSILGIRGVLDRAGDFELAEGRSPMPVAFRPSVVVYAPSACGKSSYADAVEYLFSEDGSVGHLGKGGPDSERGGQHALPHVLAEERGIAPSVSVTLVNAESGQSVQVSRLVKPVAFRLAGQTDEMPPELRPIVLAAPAHRILRQHDLTRFVVTSASEKYAQLSRWFGLTRLEQVVGQDGILPHTSRILAGHDLGWQIERHVQDIARHTNHAVTEYDERAVLDWCEAEAEKHLGKRPAIVSLEGLRKVIRTLTRLQGRIIVALSITAESYQARLALEQIATALVSPDGPLEVCNDVLTEAVAAEQRTDRLITAAKNSIFQEVWDAAQEVLESRIMDQCPVCRTAWRRTQVGSQEGALIMLTRSRDELAELAAARNEQRKATHQLKRIIKELETRLAKVQTLARELSLSEIERQTIELVKVAGALSTTESFPSQMEGNCAVWLSRCHQFVTQKLQPALESLQIMEVPVTTAQVKQAIEHLEALQDVLTRLKELHREQEEYRKVKHSFAVIAEVIQDQAAALVNDVVAALRDDVQSIYQMIHPTDAVPNIHIEPDTESSTLSVRVDFHSPDRAIPPAGYLSESQIHTLGLVLFISSVGLFNRQFPFLFLDDVFSFYDADHRERIVDLVAERLDRFQVFLTTHDEVFYSMLKDRLHDKGWLFERISGWDFEHGPQLEADTEGKR